MPDLRICHAARYQSRLTLAQRVQVFEFGRWRPAAAEELAAICAGVGDGEVSIIGIPGHLLKRWWKLAESDRSTRAFEVFGNDVATYFVYKEWPLQAPLLIEVVSSEDEPDEPLIQSRGMRLGGGVGTVLACINVDEENAAVALGTESGRIRVMLEPGEGLMLPSTGVLWNRSALDGSGLALTMLLAVLSPE
jgi:hypothetical protein